MFNFLLVLVMPFLFVGIIQRVKAFWGGRCGPSVLQPFYDFRRLIGKGEVFGNTTSFVMRVAPSMSLAALLAAALVVPMAGHQALLGFRGDFIVFSYLLALSRFWMVLGAMDTGSSFEGMGASREVTFSVFVEPAFFLIFSSFTYLAGFNSLSGIFEVLHLVSPAALVVILLAVIALFIMLLAEGCRIPVDDPATHLELTMIHEVMVLDHSGVNMAFVMYGAALKMYLFAALIAGVLIPASLGADGYWLFPFVIAGVALMVGAVESGMARLRLTHVPQMLFLTTILGVMILFVVAMGLGRIL